MTELPKNNPRRAGATARTAGRIAASVPAEGSSHNDLRHTAPVDRAEAPTPHTDSQGSGSIRLTVQIFDGQLRFGFHCRVASDLRG